MPHFAEDTSRDDRTAFHPSERATANISIFNGLTEGNIPLLGRIHIDADTQIAEALLVGDVIEDLAGGLLGFHQ